MSSSGRIFAVGEGIPGASLGTEVEKGPQMCAMYDINGFSMSARISGYLICWALGPTVHADCSTVVAGASTFWDFEVCLQRIRFKNRNYLSEPPSSPHETPARPKLARSQPIFIGKFLMRSFFGGSLRCIGSQC